MTITTAPTRPDQAQAAQGPTIRVKSLRFARQMDIPGKSQGATSSVSSTDPTSGGYWTIEFDPRIRHHRVTYFHPGPMDKPRRSDVLMIPAEAATWVPA